jgi:chemotaxis protein methyltransferase WspC
MTSLRIRRLVEERIGLDPESLGASAFDAAALAAGKAFANPDEYANTLENNREEFEKLIERLVVPETWFFRGGLLFEFLAKYIAKLAEKKVVRILSLPCSTGEEPYSLAMALMEAGVSASRWEIEAVDISRAAIATAKQGNYRKFSFRELPAHLRAKYFRSNDGSWLIADSIRKSVRFESSNIFEFDGANYDIILCRNLLIYLTPNSRRKAIERLLKMLTPTGILGVGHAEPSALADCGLAPLGPHELFLFERTTLRSVPTSDIQIIERTTIFPQPLPSTSPSLKEVVAKQRAVDTQLAFEQRTIETVRRLADAGQLAEALAECQHLLTETPSAEAFALLGLIHQALGDNRNANDSFRKALYLDPGNATAKAMAQIAGGAA